MASQISIPGKFSLPDQEKEIALKESAGWELASLAREPDDDKSDNVAKFKRLPVGQRPNRVRLRLKGDPAPPKCQQLFDCEINVASALADVTVYREK